MPKLSGAWFWINKYAKTKQSLVLTRINMPKLKVKRSVKRRFKVTGTGKVLRGSQMRSHLRSKKSKRAQRAQKEIKTLNGKFGKKIKQLLGEA